MFACTPIVVADGKILITLSSRTCSQSSFFFRPHPEGSRWGETGKTVRHGYFVSELGMPLVEYSDSEEEDVPMVLSKETQRAFQFHPRLEDPGFHSHKRVIPHAEGFWPCHVFFEFYPNAAQIAELESISNAIGFECLATTELGATQPLHLSLTETLMIPHERKPELLAAVRKWASAASSPITAIMANQLTFLTNPTGARRFAVIPVRNDNISNTIYELDSVLRSLFPDIPSTSSMTAHMSVAAGAPSERETARQQRCITTLHFDDVCVRCGTEVYKFVLG